MFLAVVRCAQANTLHLLRCGIICCRALRVFPTHFLHSFKLQSKQVLFISGCDKIHLPITCSYIKQVARLLCLLTDFQMAAGQIIFSALIMSTCSVTTIKMRGEKKTRAHHKYVQWKNLQN